VTSSEFNVDELTDVTGNFAWTAATLSRGRLHEKSLDHRAGISLRRFTF
jgi:hypothetical protein